MDYTALGRQVRMRRRSMRMTQTELSNRSNVSISFIGHIERGTRKVSVETLLNLSQALHTTPDVLLKDSIFWMKPAEQSGHVVNVLETIQQMIEQYMGGP